MNLENHRVLARRVEVRRLEDPALNSLAVETGVPDLFGLADRELREQLVVEAGQPRHGPCSGVERAHIAEDRLRGKDERQRLSAVVGRVGHDVVLALRDRIDLAGRHVDPLDVGVALLANFDQHGAAIPGPDRT